jgi:uncharacterized protein (DUF1800 family)
LDRLTFGPRPGDIEAVSRSGLKKWIEQQLHPERIKENPLLESKLAPLESLRLSPEEAAARYPQRKSADKREEAKPLNEILVPADIATLRRGTPEQKRELLASFSPEKLTDVAAALPPGQRQQLIVAAPADARRKIMMANAPQLVIAQDLIESKIYRAVYSNRQLEEVLTDFWFNHFNVFLDKGADRILTASYERDAIRPHIFGKFRDLLEATAKSPAMLFYLDNWQSVAPQPNAPPRQQSRGLNENYARELMELHTLGVDGGYTQKDIVEVARCFTGWTIRNPRLGGGFVFTPRLHDKGEKVVLGEKIPAGGGIEDGERVLDILGRHPSTAKFIARKLAVRFVSDNPPASLIDRMAKTFTKTGGDLRAVMKTMIDAPEFWSESAYRAKVKTPLEVVASAGRALNADVEWAMPLANQIAQLGQPLYRKVEPTGYSSANADWVNSAALLARMNFAIALAQNKVPGVRVDTSGFNTNAMLQDASAETRAAIGKAAPESVVGLVLGSPEFQRR